MFFFWGIVGLWSKVWVKMHRSAAISGSFAAVMRSVQVLHATLQKTARKSAGAAVLVHRCIASQAEANKAIREALKSKSDAGVIACFNKIDAHGFANDEVFDTLVKRLSKAKQWNALFYVLSHRNTRPGAQPYTPAQREMLITAFHRAPGNNSLFRRVAMLFCVANFVVGGCSSGHVEGDGSAAAAVVG
jgi:hypothetical protein